MRLRQNLHADEFDDALLARIESVVSPGTEIQTLSASLHTGPQLVPGWMIATAWRRLQKQGVLSHKELLEDLNVKRSAFVVALLAQFPDVTVQSTRPVVIERIIND
jgi:hypothetical protein